MNVEFYTYMYFIIHYIISITFHSNLLHLNTISTFQLVPENVDRCISAEIPDINVDPELHALVIKHMVHGPCGALNPSAPCMKNGVCSKNYPFAFQAVCIL